MYKQRIKIFLLIIGLTIVGLLIRLVQLQVVSGDTYRQQFENSLRYTELLPAKRGMILDRNDHVLAYDKGCYDFCLQYRFLMRDVPDFEEREAYGKWVNRQISDIMKKEGYSLGEAQEIYRRREENTWQLARELAARNQVDLDAEVQKIKDRVRRMRARKGVTLREELMPHPVVAGLEKQDFSIDDTVGASVRPSLKRWYPRNDTACHIIGVTRQVTENDQEKLNSPDDGVDWLTRMRTDYLGGDRIGNGGVERMCEGLLRGQRGYRKCVRGGEVLEVEPAQNGRDVKLTLDIDLQAEITNMLASKGIQGCAVVMSLPEGEVLAMVSVPTYDLNRYRADYNLLEADKIDRPLLHRAVGHRYPIGSCAKVVTALAGLSNGLSPETSFYCAGALDSAHPNVYRCHGGPHGTLSLTQAIKVSCNVYFYNVARRVGGGKMSASMRLFGYGSKPGAGLLEETAGFVPRHVDFEYEQMQWAIGQGRFDASPLQVCAAMGAIARGEYVSPMLAFEGGPMRVHRNIPVPDSYLKAVQKGMWMVVNEPGGTGYSAFREGAGTERLDIIACGKTGTADPPPLKVDGQIVKGGDGKTNMAWFAGYAPYVSPKVAFAVVVEYTPDMAGKVAGPIARDVLKMCKARGYLK